MVQMFGPHLRSAMNSTETRCGNVIYSCQHIKKTSFVAVVLKFPPSVAICIRLGGRRCSMQNRHRIVSVSREHVFDVSLVCDFPFATKGGFA
jgi:hypothetical protein